MEHEEAIARCQQNDPGGPAAASAWEVRESSMKVIRRYVLSRHSVLVNKLPCVWMRVVTAHSDRSPTYGQKVSERKHTQT